MKNLAKAIAEDFLSGIFFSINDAVEGEFDKTGCVLNKSELTRISRLLFDLLEQLKNFSFITSNHDDYADFEGYVANLYRAVNLQLADNQIEKKSVWQEVEKYIKSGRPDFFLPGNREKFKKLLGIN